MMSTISGFVSGTHPEVERLIFAFESTAATSFE
jgi:hypothetical protein